MKNFFERWIYKSGHPIYQTTWKQIGKSSLEITLKQLQTDDVFLQPVTIEIQTNKGAQRITITPDDKETTVKIKSAKPRKLVIDPDEFILKETVN